MNVELTSMYYLFSVETLKKMQTELAGYIEDNLHDVRQGKMEHDISAMKNFVAISECITEKEG